MHKDMSWYLFLQSSSSVVTQNWLHCDYHLTQGWLTNLKAIKWRVLTLPWKQTINPWSLVKLVKPMKALAKRTFHFFTTASVSCCLLFFVWCLGRIELQSNLKIPKSTWVPWWSQSSETFVEFDLPMRQGVETSKRNVTSQGATSL